VLVDVTQKRALRTMFALGAGLVLFGGYLIAPGTQAQALVPHLVPANTVHAIPFTRKVCGAPKNQWGFNHCGGRVIYEPPSGFCRTFLCIGNFNRGRGYVVQCRSGAYSKSGGVRGACSWHGGVARALYK
jgi:hypothetical protein